MAPAVGSQYVIANFNVGLSAGGKISLAANGVRSTANTGLLKTTQKTAIHNTIGSGKKGTEKR
jgi:hypothetical protein